MLSQIRAKEMPNDERGDSPMPNTKPSTPLELSVDGSPMASPKRSYIAATGAFPNVPVKYGNGNARRSMNMVQLGEMSQGVIAFPEVGDGGRPRFTPNVEKHVAAASGDDIPDLRVVVDSPVSGSTSPSQQTPSHQALEITDPSSTSEAHHQRTLSNRLKQGHARTPSNIKDKDKTYRVVGDDEDPERFA